MSMKELQEKLDAVFGRRPAVAVAIVEQRRRAASAMSKARRLAKKHGIELERERDGYWVTHPSFDDGDDDPRQGEHFCVGGEEVLEAVGQYVEAIAKRAA